MFILKSNPRSITNLCRCIVSIIIGAQLCESVKYFILTNFVFEVLYFFGELFNFFLFFLFASNVYAAGTYVLLRLFPTKVGML